MIPLLPLFVACASTAVPPPCFPPAVTPVDGEAAVRAWLVAEPGPPGMRFESLAPVGCGPAADHALFDASFAWESPEAVLVTGLLLRKAAGRVELVEAAPIRDRLRAAGGAVESLRTSQDSLLAAWTAAFPGRRHLGDSSKGLCVNHIG